MRPRDQRASRHTPTTGRLRKHVGSPREPGDLRGWRPELSQWGPGWEACRKGRGRGSRTGMGDWDGGRGLQRGGRQVYYGQIWL